MQFKLDVSGIPILYLQLPLVPQEYQQVVQLNQYFLRVMNGKRTYKMHDVPFFKGCIYGPSNIIFNKTVSFLLPKNFIIHMYVTRVVDVIYFVLFISRPVL